MKGQTVMLNPIFSIVRYNTPQGQALDEMTTHTASGVFLYQVPDYTPFQLPGLAQTVISINVPGSTFFCNWCADTGLRKYSEGPYTYESDCNQCVGNPLASDEYILWQIAKGNVPALEVI